jgi:AMP phosphorylase
MKLKIRNFNWLAGRPIAVLNDKTAKKLNVFVDDRIAIDDGKRAYAVVDIFPRLVRKNEIGLSQELSKVLKLKDKSYVEIGPSELSGAPYLIKKRMEGETLSQEEMTEIVSAIVHNNLTEAEIAFFVAAEKLRKSSFNEIVDLTRAMVKTGVKLKPKGKYIADKHCAGGVAGNRTTPIIVAICAAAGLTLPKTSSRAITSAAGTADTIETISNVELSLDKIKSVVGKTGACLAWGGSLGLAPSDDKIIRVERLLNLDVEPQLLASIMSKKIAGGAKYVLIDLPYGKGSKISSLKKAQALGKKFMNLGREFGLKMKVVYTNGSQPIGNGFGPALEMLDVLAVLQNAVGAPKDLRDKSAFLSVELMKLCGIKNAGKKVEEILSSGKAYEKFKEIINAQNGAKNFDKKVAALPVAKFKKIIRAKRTGKIFEIRNGKINSLCRVLGAPETVSAGAYLHKHIGKIKKGDPLITLYSESRKKLRDAVTFMKKSEPIKIK